MSVAKYDALVVGAGPAGSRVARDLASRGLSVALIEENADIGVPCHCSGLVTPRTLELAGVGDGVVHNDISGAVVHLASGERLRVGGDRLHAHVIDRVELDRRLAAQAVDAGAHLMLRTRFVKYELCGDARGHSGEVLAEVIREGVPTTLAARILIGADGALSRVARQIRGTAPTGVVFGLGADAEYRENPLPNHVEIFLDPDAAPGWFGWTIPVADGRARLGTGSANGIKPIESFRRLQRRFPDSFGRAVVRSHTGGTIALWEPTPMVADRVVLVGDAARQVKPTSGGGIHAALHAAGLAARTVADALGKSDVSARALGRYSRSWHRTIGRELRRQHDMRRTFTRLDGEKLSRILATLDHAGLRANVESIADIDYLSRAARTFALRKPLMAARLLGVPRFPAAWLFPWK